MSNLLIAAGLAVVVIATNLYWYRRERTVRESLRTSLEWDRAPAAADPDARRQIAAVAETVDAAPEDAPEAVESLDEKVRQLQGDLDQCRETWAEVVRDLLRSHVDAAVPLVVHLEGGTDADATALAKAVERDGVTVVSAPRDSTFVVTSGDPETHSAAAIASAATEGLPGGAGGSPAFAQGGGDERTLEAIESVCADRTERSPVVLRLGGPVGRSDD